ncbi:hypothetical protein DRB96_11120 [Streptomyces sp. ICC1]|nr:hypothetical protein DRB89_12085 [Streptomyces sp. ICC4]AWZ12789.1 hypothetical protein DRB96_11120 [Streptomyces sp. ICC1]
MASFEFRQASRSVGRASVETWDTRLNSHRLELMTERPPERLVNRLLAGVIREAGFSNAELARRVAQLLIRNGSGSGSLSWV